MHEALSKLKFDKDVAVLTAEYAKKMEWTVHSMTFPTLDVTIAHSVPVRLCFTCDSWDEQPPSIKILKPDGTPWSGALPPGNVFHPNKFICMRGSREYYSIGGHHVDSWENYRGKAGMNLVGILMQLSTHWRTHMK